MLGNHGGGAIDVRSLGGQILATDRAFDNAKARSTACRPAAELNSNTVVLATAWSGAGISGLNLLTSSLGVVNDGFVLPADLEPSDDIGVGTPSNPPPLFTTTGELGVWW